MLNILFELAKSQEYACFYCDPQSNKFKFGYVLAVNKNEIALHELSPDGEDDGVVVIATEKVYRVERNTSYVEMMKKLCCEKNIVDWLSIGDQRNILFSILSNQSLKEHVVSIELNDSGYYATSGFVNHLENGQCCITQIDDYGFEDGITYLFISDITELVISSDLEKRIQKLWEINSK